MKSFITINKTIAKELCLAKIEEIKKERIEKDISYIVSYTKGVDGWINWLLRGKGLTFYEAKNKIEKELHKTNCFGELKHSDYPSFYKESVIQTSNHLIKACDLTRHHIHLTVDDLIQIT